MCRWFRAKEIKLFGASLFFSQKFLYISNTMKDFDLHEKTTVFVEEVNCKCDKNTENIRT